MDVRVDGRVALITGGSRGLVLNILNTGAKAPRPGGALQRFGQRAPHQVIWGHHPLKWGHYS